MDKEWIRQTVEENIKAIYGLRNPAPEDQQAMVENLFAQCPTFQFPGFIEQNPLFGSIQGVLLLKDHFQKFFNAVEVLKLEKQYIIVDGFSADAHYLMELRFKESGSRYEFELLLFMDIDMEGKIRDLKLYFDTATFLKAVNTKNGTFRDVREAVPHTPFKQDFPLKAGALVSDAYVVFGIAYYGFGQWDDFYSRLADNVEVVFKSNVDVLPYAGEYSGTNGQGFKNWLNDLLSLWSLNAFNFTKVYTEGNAADFMMHELHYYNNPDGTKRYLDVYIVQSAKINDDGKIELFKSYNDSAWLDETFYASEVYKRHYGYPADYPKGLRPDPRVEK